jgi:hypothetical protein
MHLGAHSNCEPASASNKREADVGLVDNHVEDERAFLRHVSQPPLAQLEHTFMARERFSRDPRSMSEICRQFRTAAVV